MPVLSANGIELCYERNGDGGRAPVLLLHGLGCQLVHWPDMLVEGLVVSGFDVLRVDNRDVGLSEKLDALGTVDVMALAVASASGKPVKPPYALRDMADDAVSLLDRLACPAAHLVGVSMGGMIAQRVAIHHPDRVLSLTSIMSSSGAPGLPPPDPAAIGSIMAAPMGTSRAEIVAQLEKTWDLIGGPHFRSTEVGMGRKAAMAFDRGRFPAGFMRQMAAVIADGGRAELLARVCSPTLVIHGDIDPLVPMPCGEDTAARIPGARLKVMPRMGHDLPDPLIPEILDALIAHFKAGAEGANRPAPADETSDV